MFKTLMRMLHDWSVGYNARQFDEWLTNRTAFSDLQMAKVVVLVNQQRQLLDREFSTSFLNPLRVLAEHPMIGSRLEGMIARMQKNGENLA